MARSERSGSPERGRTIAWILGAAGVLVGLTFYAVGSEPEHPLDPNFDLELAETGSETGAPGVDRVVLVTIDTLRADHLSSYGYRLETTPFLDSLAGGGVRFETAIATSSHTAPSHASIFTGLFPSQHGLAVNGSRLKPGTVTLPCVLADAGFATAGFTSVSFLDGLSGCFETFDSIPAGARLYSPAESVLDHATTWLREQAPSARFFLWVHLFDVHEWKYADDVRSNDLKTMRDARGGAESHFRYIATRHGLTLEGGKPSTWGTFKDRSGDRVPVDVSTIEQVVRWVDHYDAQLRRVDEGLAKLANVIDGQRFEGRTLWVVTADHGEGLGSHGYHGHGAHLYDEQLRVPLIVYASGGAIRPGVVDSLVRHIDLFPTLVELTRAPARPNAAREGRSFVGLLQGRGDDNPRIAFAERRPVDEMRRREGWSDESVCAIRSRDAKVIWHSKAPEEFFDLEHDPLELDPLRGSSMFEQLEARLASHLVRLETAAPDREPPDEHAPQLDPEIEEQLRGLGYIQ